eukprot:4307576-Amphidinium_carterae.1
MQTARALCNPQVKKCRPQRRVQPNFSRGPSYSVVPVVYSILPGLSGSAADLEQGLQGSSHLGWLSTARSAQLQCHLVLCSSCSSCAKTLSGHMWPQAKV